MAFPIIGFDSMLHLVTPADPGTAAGFAIADIHDHRSFSIWKSNVTTTPIQFDIDMGGSTADADFIALINHTLTTEVATVRVQNGASTPSDNELLAAVTPVSDVASLITFTSNGAKRHWRVEIAKGGGFTNAPFIGELLLGVRTTLTEFLSPGIDPFQKTVEVEGTRSQGGNYLGAILKTIRRRAILTFGGDAGMARTFLTSDLNAFLDTHALLRLPFAFVLDSADSDFDETRWLRVTDEGELTRIPVAGKWSRFQVTLPVEEAQGQTP